jgi:uncharacterized protein YutE (UPF0331/DUF86 family)
MTPGRIRSDVVAERIAWIREMIASIKRLPLSDYEAFINDPRNSAAAESYLRRAIEALLDLGRHILAKGFGFAVTEYKDIGVKLSETDVISGSQGLLLRKIAGYRNRMVHFYHEVSIRELFDLCTRNVHDIEILLDSFISWIRGNPEKMDQPW